jgi:hypothetical protein
MRAIVDAKAVVLPQPETTGDWWQRPQRQPALLTKEERDQLLAAVYTLVARTGF